MVVVSQIVDIRAPILDFTRSEEFGLEVDVDATGEGSSRLLLALWDRYLNRYISAWATTEPLPAGKYVWTITLNPLDEWYPTPMPGIFEWTAVAGYMTDETGVATDSQDFKMPRIVDRVCNQYYCVGVSNPYPAPREEIAISGRLVYPMPWPWSCEDEGTLLLADEMVVDETKTRDECYFCFFLKAPVAEGGYTFWVRHDENIAWKSSPIGIWVTAPPACEDYTTKEECEAHGCVWYDNACHSPPIRCEDIMSESDCIAHGCYWWSGGCHSSPQPLWDKYRRELTVLAGAGIGLVGIMAIR